MDLILPPHLREAGHPVPRDDPPHDSRPREAAPADQPPAVEARSRRTPCLRRAVCGLIDWRRAEAMHAGAHHIARPSSATPTAGASAG